MNWREELLKIDQSEIYSGDNPEFKDCVILTYNGVVARLNLLDKVLAERYNLSGNIREQFIEKMKSDSLEEDGLIQEWLRYHSVLVHWND